MSLKYYNLLFIIFARKLSNIDRRKFLFFKADFQGGTYKS